MRRSFLLLGLLMVIGSCGHSADTSATSAPPITVAATTTLAAATTPPTSAATAATAPVTATAAATTTTTTAPFTEGPYVLEDPSFAPPLPLAQSDGSGGSGCAPGLDTITPDGIWYGNVLGITPGVITFDMACFYFGDIAYDEAAKDGEEIYGVHYVRNHNPLTREVPIGPGATIHWLDNSSGEFVLGVLPMADWPGPSEALDCPGVFCGVWLYINDGVITEAIEQYTP